MYIRDYFMSIVKHKLIRDETWVDVMNIENRLYRQYSPTVWAGQEVNSLKSLVNAKEYLLKTPDCTGGMPM